MVLKFPTSTGFHVNENKKKIVKIQKPKILSKMKTWSGDMADSCLSTKFAIDSVHGFWENTFYGRRRMPHATALALLTQSSRAKNRKYNGWPQSDLERYKARGTLYILNYCPPVPNFTPCRSTIARFPHNWVFLSPEGTMVNLKCPKKCFKTQNVRLKLKV